MLHNFQVSIYTVPFSFILFVLVSGLQPSPPGSFYSLFSRCLPFSNLFSILTLSGHACRNVALTKQDRSLGRISGFVHFDIPGMYLTCELNFIAKLYTITGIFSSSESCT